ncbi:hypothetical protein LCGC14_0633490 [marine sediment metagenome]|uniref:Uncharacterized protein n=1 Tax=marine sediment metagenome TaxID=412755 RepID=A0A0F9U9S7_9ZZZZ
MINLSDPILELIAYELAAIFGIIALVLIVNQRKKFKRAETATAKAVKKIKRDREQREQALTDILKDKYGLTDDALEVEVNDFIERERRIQKSLVKTFIEQDPNSFTAIPELIEQAVDAALNIEPVGTQHEAVEQKEPVVIEDLQSQIDHAAQTMERLMLQYQALQTVSSDSIPETNAEIATEPDVELADDEPAAFSDQAVDEQVVVDDEPTVITEPDQMADELIDDSSVPQEQVADEQSDVVEQENEAPLEQAEPITDAELEAVLGGDDFELEDINADSSAEEAEQLAVEENDGDIIEIDGDSGVAEKDVEEELTDDDINRFTDNSPDVEISGGTGDADIDSILSETELTEKKPDTSLDLRPSVEQPVSLDQDSTGSAAKESESQAIDDIDALLEQEAEPAIEPEAETGVDNIDALLEQDAEPAVAAEVDPEPEAAIDEIDALLEQEAEPAVATEVEPEPAIDDIDALLEQEAEAEAGVDDIDALLEQEAEPAVAADVEPEPAIDDIDAVSEEQSESTIDAELESGVNELEGLEEHPLEALTHLMN